MGQHRNALILPGEKQFYRFLETQLKLAHTDLDLLNIHFRLNEV